MTAQGTLPFERHSEGSRAAAERVAPHAPNMRRRVYNYIAYSPRVCDQAIAIALKMKLKTVNARRRELEEVGLIRPDGLTQSPKASSSTAWVVTGNVYPDHFPNVRFTAARRRAETPTAEDFHEVAEILRAARHELPAALFTPAARKAILWIERQPWY